MQTTQLSTESILPLTCSRSGTCCFGKAVMLNPWELFCFSKEKKISQSQKVLIFGNLSVNLLKIVMSQKQLNL